MNIKEIRKAFDALNGVFYCASTNWAESLFELCRKEEKGHRGFGDDFRKYHPDAASVADMARLFAVKRVAQYLTGDKWPSGREYLHTQTSCFIAAGIADEFGKEVTAALAPFDLKVLAELDYCDYVKVDKAVA